ncbi:hypothetical protein BK133_01045 [Paenibacillus sp. FSL H8-0548]|uniref:ParA family protein n=1 Tax=Paenibacillus sp. FSL H8-0548 TaxID=1920422 RepID=UPI00096C7415|nr:ParA family protein [Paenibacillus sp. FSL H8-0548]OMF38820.1 hypothetical protein BK133_01045 [Paenibacillus sp. FSL H8-0548]
MSKYQLAVAVKEQEYLKRLAYYIRDSRLGEQWQVIAFTHVEACKQYVKQGYPIDLLAAQPELLAALKLELPSVPAAALVLKLGESGEEHELLQYQPLKVLLQRLTEIHARAALSPISINGASKNVSGVKIISVYSAAGGTGKTALALHLVHAASTSGCRTFYLNLERWNSAEIWLGTERQGSDSEREGLSELLYGLKAQPEKSVNWLIEHRKHDTLLQGDYLAPFTNLEDRMTLSQEDALGIVEAAAGSGLYDLIVIDLESGLDELHIAVFEKSSQVLWTLSEALSVREKQMMAIRYGSQKWGERFNRLIPKFLSVNTSAAAAARPGLGMSDSIAHARVKLPEISEWRGAGHVRLLSSPLYRAAVDKLYKQLYSEEG